MDKYNGLLSKVSRQYHILRGTQETENEWKARLVYSICGMMAYACLWDDTEDPVSIVHLKRRIRGMLANYKLMYPELSDSLPYVPEELEDEIKNQFLNTGVIYHCPNRIAPSIKHEELFNGILFQRGIAQRGYCGNFDVQDPKAQGRLAECGDDQQGPQPDQSFFARGTG